MRNHIHPTTISPSEEPWVEISIEIHERLQDSLANFFIELGANGVVVDEERVDLLSGKVKTDKQDHKLICAYLKKDIHFQQKITALERYLKSLRELHLLQEHPQMRLKITKDEDWNKKWQTFFTTTRIGTHFIIKPSWELYLSEEGDIIIEMDPGMAFGTGTHPTTRMCLEAIEHLMGNGTKSIYSMLDVGVGSGILSIAAAKLGIPRIVGIDIDPIALRYAQQNAEKNCVSDRVEVQTVSLKKVEGKFDLVAANILSEVIIKLRKDLYYHLAEGGLLILSGILEEHNAKVARKMVSKKLSLCDTYHHTGWTCLVLQKQ